TAAKYSPGRAHAGFHMQQRRLLRLCIDELHERLSQPHAVLLCVGHSAGACVAALTALQLVQCYGDAISFIGFGMPRLGD
ncbi:hypothetical protein JKP88DRAFT_154776, partial [Tribonema minus]